MKVSIGKVAIAAVILLALYSANFLYALNSGAEGGTLGDTFGAVNALFSGSALFFLILAFLSQREELNLVKEERNDTRALLSGQEEISKLQKSALDKQLFENSFFSRMTLLAGERSRLMSIDVSIDAHRPQLLAVTHACEKLTIELALGSVISPDERQKLDLRADNAFFFINQVAALVEFIETAELETSEAKNYLSLVRGLIDYNTATCFSWFFASSVGKNKAILKAYQTLSIKTSVSPILREALVKLEERYEIEPV